MNKENRQKQIISGGKLYQLKDYQINFCLLVENEVGFTGLDVLEVGGSLPEGFVLDILKAKSWLALEEPEFWKVSGKVKKFDKVFPSFLDIQLNEKANYAVITDGIENLTSCFYNQFDLVFSIAAMQHILRMGPAMFSMFHSLRQGGRLLAGIGPIWSASDGHLLRSIFDSIGREISWATDVIPAWAHLIWEPAEFYIEMCKRTDRRTAGEIVYEVFNSNRINRLFLRDYFEYINLSPFQAKSDSFRDSLLSVIRQPMPDTLKKYLSTRYPGYQHFEISNFSLSLERL